MNLLNVFQSVAYKELVAVDLPYRGSNQHEMNGTASLRSFFETSETVRGKIEWRYFSDNGEVLRDRADFTFYDARKNHPTRTEWRMYYYGDFLSRAEEGDVLVLARTGTTGDKNQRLFGLIFPRNSGWLRSAEMLFGFAGASSHPEIISREKLSQTDLELSRTVILDELDIEVDLPVATSDENLVLEHFPHSFPSTKEMSQFAREHTEVDIADADGAIVQWVQREEQLFRALEGIEIKRRINQGFNEVEEFTGYALSVLNRRKARMGRALENHLETVLIDRRIRYGIQAETENGNKPDFLFPGKAEYHDLDYPSELLAMLAAKSTCKDRWRQILPEANRIPHKHLCTLDQAISGAQLEQMRGQNVTLVVPRLLQAAYGLTQPTNMLNVASFIDMVLERQR